MEHAETKHLERAPARGPARPAHGRSRPAAPLHTVRRRHRAYPGAAPGTQPAGLRAPDRAPRRNPRPLERASNTAWPGSTCSPPSSSTGIRPSRLSGQTAETRGADSRARHPAHRRIPVVKTPITALAYDSAPCRSRPPRGGCPGSLCRNPASTSSRPGCIQGCPPRWGRR